MVDTTFLYLTLEYITWVSLPHGDFTNDILRMLFIKIMDSTIEHRLGSIG